jgi:molybdopterin-containing oxidoreductase family membrane subunit
MATAPKTLSYVTIRDDLFRPLSGVSRAYLVATLTATIVGVTGFAAWGYQLHSGMGVTGLDRPVFWGIYIVDFVFWIGISHAGTLISAILRLTGAAWRKPITRVAEAITVFALMIGGMFPIIHLGRAWRFYWLLPYPNLRLLWPNFRSPLLWDLTAIVTYMIGSVTYLYLPLIPDMAQLAGQNTDWRRRRLYRALSLGWAGSDREWHALERAMKLMACLILAVAVSVHTVVAWDFAMSIAPMWHSTIFGPYFVTGAIYSGIAALIVVMAVLRKVLNLRAYFTPHHFNNLAKLLLLLSLLWFYFTVAENLTAWYGNEPKEMDVLGARTRGPYAPFFWTMVVLNFAVPFVLLGVRRLRTILTATIASVCVLAGMWIERYMIVVPTLGTPRMVSASGGYSPTWVELAITAATFAAMAMLYLIFSKMFPIIAVWEFQPQSAEEE